MYSALSGPTNWIPRYIRTYLYLCSNTKGAFLYSAVSGYDHQKRVYTSTSYGPVHSTANSTSLEVLSLAAITARRLLVRLSITVNSQVLIYTPERIEETWSERNCQVSKRQIRGFESGFSHLDSPMFQPQHHRVPHDGLRVISMISATWYAQLVKLGVRAFINLS